MRMEVSARPRKTSIENERSLHRLEHIRVVKFRQCDTIQEAFNEEDSRRMLLGVEKIRRSSHSLSPICSQGEVPKIKEAVSEKVAPVPKKRISEKVEGESLENGSLEELPESDN